MLIGPQISRGLVSTKEQRATWLGRPLGAEGSERMCVGVGGLFGLLRQSVFAMGGGELDGLIWSGLAWVALSGFEWMAWLRICVGNGCLPAWLVERMGKSSFR